MARDDEHQAAAHILDVDGTPSTDTRTPSSAPPLPALPDSPSRADTPQQRAQPQPQQQTLPFWNTNLPPSRHTSTCPPYLFYALHHPKDRAILSTPDAAYRRQTWPEICGFIRANRLDLFQRVPSELRLYREYCHALAEQYGSVMEFVVRERLGWGDLHAAAASDGGGAEGRGFEDPENYKILHNDWPYGIDPRIVHLVVWTKFPLPPDPASAVGDISPATRAMIQDFVDRTFGTRGDRVVWFVNWASLKSIHAVEHFHVMLWEPEEEFVRGITKGDVAVRDVVRRGGR